MSDHLKRQHTDRYQLWHQSDYNSSESCSDSQAHVSDKIKQNKTEKLYCLTCDSISNPSLTKLAQE
jgi:hypothetical protein